jgi:hypothetical protein
MTSSTSYGESFPTLYSITLQRGESGRIYMLVGQNVAENLKIREP